MQGDGSGRGKGMGGGYDSQAGGKRPEMPTTWSDPNFAGKFARQDPQQLDARASGAPTYPDDWKRGYGSRDKRGPQQWARDDSGRDDGSDYSSGQRPSWHNQQQGHARAPQGSAASSRRPSRLGSPTYSPPPETARAPTANSTGNATLDMSYRGMKYGNPSYGRAFTRLIIT